MEGRVLEGGPGVRDAAQHRVEVAADGVVFVALGDAEPELVVQLVHRVAAVHHGLVVGDDLERLLLGQVVLVADLADDLLQHVLQGDDPGGASVLVDHDHHVGLFEAHLVEQLVDLLLLRHGVDGPQQALDPELIGTGAAHENAEQVLGVDQPDDVVDVLLVDRKPGMALALDDLGDLLQAGALLDGDHVGAGDHHLADQLVADLDDRLDHLPLFLFDYALLLGDAEQRHQLGLGDEGSDIAAAGHHDPAHRGHEPEDRGEDGRQPVHRGSHLERHLVGVAHGQGLGCDLGEDQQEEREQKADPEVGGGSQAVRQVGVEKVDPDQRRGGRGDDQGEGVDDQHRPQEALRILL